MDNPNISETSREKLEDAAAFVIMEQYAKALNAGINKRMEDCAEEVFPEELDKRCRALIAQASRKAQNKKRRKSVLRVLRSAAVVALVMLSLCSVLFVTVEAFRLPVMNFFIEKTNRYWQISEELNENTTQEVFNAEDPLDGIIPDEFDLVNLVGSWEEDCLSADYVNGDNSSISLFVIPSGGSYQIDTEAALTTQCEVAGHNAVLSTEENMVRVMWSDKHVSKTFAICATNISGELVMVFAESLAKLFE